MLLPFSTETLKRSALLCDFTLVTQNWCRDGHMNPHHLMCWPASDQSDFLSEEFEPTGNQRLDSDVGIPGREVSQGVEFVCVLTRLGEGRKWVCRKKRLEQMGKDSWREDRMEQGGQLLRFLKLFSPWKGQGN